MRPLATDTHDFPSIRRDGRIYVDKTSFMHRLVSRPNARIFFISRPRRFGKSLTVSAFKALFQGRRELFEGFAETTQRRASAATVLSKTDFPTETTASK